LCRLTTPVRNFSERRYPNRYRVLHCAGDNMAAHAKCLNNCFAIFCVWKRKIVFFIRKRWHQKLRIDDQYHPSQHANLFNSLREFCFLKHVKPLLEKLHLILDRERRQFLDMGQSIGRVERSNCSENRYNVNHERKLILQFRPALKNVSETLFCHVDYQILLRTVQWHRHNM